MQENTKSSKYLLFGTFLMYINKIRRQEVFPKDFENVNIRLLFF